MIRDTKNGRFIKEDDLKRFMRFVDKQPNGCWNWLGFKDKDGYGRFWLEEQKIYKASRASYYLFNKVKPKNLICHKCDNPPCVNPDHLFDGTFKDNAKDALNKGRLAIGEKINTNKLKEKQVTQIRNLYKKGEITQEKLAFIYNVSKSNISSIINGKTWKFIN